MKYVDLLLCDDDPHSTTKVGRHNIDFICGELQVDPSKAVLVGDATSDFSNVDTSKGDNRFAKTQPADPAPTIT
jgi:hypothetical protein